MLESNSLSVNVKEDIHIPKSNKLLILKPIMQASSPLTNEKLAVCSQRSFETRYGLRFYHFRTPQRERKVIKLGKNRHAG